MTQELAVRQAEVGIFLQPDQVLENARTAARALKQVIALKTNPVIINGEQYLEMEDWELCGQFYGYTVKTGDAVPVEVDGVKGAKAQADLIDIKTGLYVGGAEAYCMRDEERWNTRPTYEWQGEGAARKRVKTGDEVVPWFQLASMAQTRAGAKAFRNRLAWVVVLAGYRPTPAEEMTEGTVSEAVRERRTVDPTAHYCPTHNVNFFKKGRMRSYAHPIEGTDPLEWCQEDKPIHTVQQVAREMAKAESSPSPAGTQADFSPPVVDKGDDLADRGTLEEAETISPFVAPPAAGGIDMDWLRDNIGLFGGKNANLVGWLRSKANFQGMDFSGSLSEIIARFTQEQAKFLNDEIESRRAMR